MRRTALLVALLLLPTASAAWTAEGGSASRAGTVAAPIPTSAIQLLWNATGQYPGALVLPDGAVVGWGDPVTVWEKDGTPRWSTRTVGPQSQVFVARGAALLSNGSIVAAGSLPFGAPAVVGYDPADGKQFLFDRTFASGQRCDSLEDNAVAVGPDDSFYVGNCGPGVVAYHKNGTRKWNWTGEAERVALGATHVYVEAEDVKLANGTTVEDALVALSQADGTVAWATPLEDGSGDPLVAPDGTILLRDAGTIRAFTPDGAPKWRTQVPRPYGLAVAPNGTIAAGSSNSVSWLSPADGKITGATRTVDGTALLVGANVHLRISGATVVAVGADGTTLWQVNGTARNFVIKPAIADDGTLYLPEEGQMRAYRGEGGAARTPTPTSSPTASETAPTPTSTAGSTSPPAEGGDATPFPAAGLLLALVGALALLRRRR